MNQAIIAVIYTVVAGIFFGVWPFVMGKSDATSLHLIILGIGSLIAGITGLCYEPQINVGTIVRMSIIFAFIAALMNGFGQLFYVKMIAIAESAKDINLSVLLVLASVTMVVTQAVGGLIKSEPVTKEKIIGIILAIPVMILLSWKSPSITE